MEHIISCNKIQVKNNNRVNTATQEGDSDQESERYDPINYETSQKYSVHSKWLGIR